MAIEVKHGKCEEVLKDYADNYFDSVVADPPYGISFMNKHWDYQVPSVEQWKEIIRVLKPGGHLLCACGTRTQHRMVVNIEDAGFEIRDVITWHYGSGFPKSLDVSKAIDKKFGAERTEVIGSRNLNSYTTKEHGNSMNDGIREDFEEVNKMYAAVTEEAKEWDGWGTALKPATEFWTLARKPLSEDTIAQNVLKHGTGGINIDGCRIGTDEMVSGGSIPDIRANNFSNSNGKERLSTDEITKQGRFPSNLILDEFMAEELDKQSGISQSKQSQRGVGLTESNGYGKGDLNYDTIRGFDDEGGSSRFFYVAKPSQYERNKGLKDFEKVVNGVGALRDGGRESLPRGNNHPTVKPIELMRYLVKLITPKHGICLDPYCGSGTTLIACKLELINAVGIDKEKEHCELSEARVAAWNPEKYIKQTLF